MKTSDTTKTNLRLGLPKGRMERGILSLLSDAGIEVKTSARSYRPSISMPDTEVKVLKPHNVIEMLALGSRDLGFAGADWVMEKQVDVVELLDTGLDPVQIVAAAPAALLVDGRLPERLTEGRGRTLLIASEYERLTRAWIADSGLDADFVRSYGATEVFPPEDADVIVDNRSTGTTLVANGLEVIDVLATSSTRLYASPQAMADASKRQRVDDFTLLIKSVLEARRRVMIEVNASSDNLERVVALLPCMREATVSPLFGSGGYAIKAAVLRERVAEIVPAIKAAGGTDVAITSLAQIVP